MHKKRGVRVPLRLLTLSAGLLAIVALLLLPGTASPVQAEEATSLPACAITPETLGGQGFSTIGTSFSTFGLSFSTFGLGFSTIGTGFSLEDLSGVNVDALVDEILNSRFDSGWVQALLPNVTGLVGYNSEPAAILVVDDFTNGGANSHGAQVVEILQDLQDKLPNLNIQIVQIDIGEPGTGYQIDLIVPRLQAAMAALEAEGVQNFVFNFSFAMIPCEDPEIGFNFQEAIAMVVEANESTEVNNILECVSQNADGTYTAHFGYETMNRNPVTIPYGDSNFLTGGGLSPEQLQAATPTYFTWPNVVEGRPGRSAFYPNSAFQVIFDGSNLVWNLNGSTETANASSNRCSPPVRPILECVADNGDGTYTAHFGARNDNPFPVTVLPGDSNKLTGGGLSAAVRQAVTPTYFPPGRTPFFPDSAYQIVFDGSNLVWSLNGRTSTANAESTACIFPVGYGLSDYFVDELNVPQEQIDETIKSLVDSVDDSLNGFRAFLQQQLVRSQNGEVDVVSLASSGNFAPWLGSAPLAPARWPETIAVSAGVTNLVTPWFFSHEGNVRAPGVTFQRPDGSVSAGTSFASPTLARYVAELLTVPGLCTYPTTVDPTDPSRMIVRPPLLEPDVLGNAIPVLGTFAPFSCAQNTPPSADTDSPTFVDEGEEVAKTVNVSDAEGNIVSIEARFAETETVLGTWTLEDGDAFNGVYQWNYTPDDGPVSGMVIITVTDAGGETAMTDFFFEVSNVAPTATFSGPAGPVLVGESAIFSFSNPDDVSAADTETGFRYLYNCDNDEVFEIGPTTETSVECIFETPGTKTVGGRILDKDNGGTSYAATVLVEEEETFFGVTGFTLVDSRSNLPVIDPLLDGAVIDLSTLAEELGSNLNIVATTSPEMVGSVKLELRRAGESALLNEGDSVDDFFPYSVFGDVEGDFNDGTLEPGSYILIATPYTGKDAEGEAGSPLQIAFTVIDSDVKDPETPQVLGLVLVDSRNNVDLFPLTEGMVINRAELGRALNIRAEVTNTEIINRVRFWENGRVVRNERVAPYALAGDNEGNYNRWRAEPGNYTLLVEIIVNGEVVDSATISFILTDGDEIEQDSWGGSETIPLPVPPDMSRSQ